MRDDKRDNDKRDNHDNRDMKHKRICDLLEGFPVNFPVDNVIVFGVEQATTNFVSVANGVAIFRNNAEIKIFDCGRIDGLDLI